MNYRKVGVWVDKPRRRQIIQSDTHRERHKKIGKSGINQREIRKKDFYNHFLSTGDKNPDRIRYSTRLLVMGRA